MKTCTTFILTLLTFAAFAQNDSLVKDSVAITLNKNYLAESQSSEVYKLNLAADIPITAVGTGWSIFAFTKIYNKDASTIQEIENLDKNDVPSFDRSAAGNNNRDANVISDYPFYGSLAVPLGLIADREIRQDLGKIGFIYLEAMAITGLFYTGSVYFVDRYRPATYDTSIPAEERAKGNNKDSFIAGHPGMVATATFFTAKVYSDYHPDSDFKYALYGLAVAATGATSYLRLIAGKHFPSDLLAGVTVGTLSGILVPHFHKNKMSSEPNLGIRPFSTGMAHGISMTYKIR